jgi:ribosomal protein S18 acetylase RimI-like enzyme
MDSPIIITHKKLRHEEILSLLKKFDSCFDPPFSCSVNLEEYAIKLFNNACFVIAESANNILGILVYYKNQAQHEIYIPYLAVDLSFQSLSIGRHMLEELVRHVGLNYYTIVLEVMKRNTRAISFYRSNAFVCECERGDKLLMRRLLVDANFR